MIIGIDNGLSGGLVAISKSHGLLIRGIAMPTIQISGENVPNVRAIRAWISQFTKEIAITVVVEECPMHANQASTMRSMGMSYGVILAALYSLYNVAEIITCKSGNSKESWQRQLLGVGTTKAKIDTKSIALSKATEIWPDMNWVCNEFGCLDSVVPTRLKKPHTGLIDAALIAHWFRGNTVTPTK